MGRIGLDMNKSDRMVELLKDFAASKEAERQSSPDEAATHRERRNDIKRQIRELGAEK
jgi:hypothetical protein